MNRWLLRIASLLVMMSSFTGCIFIKVTSVKVDGDLVLPPPPVVPDSVKSGRSFVQLGLRLNPARQSTKDSFQWNSGPVGGDLGVQYVASRHIRVLGGASVSSSPSGWAGVGLNVRNRYLAWDFETLMGATWADVQIHGRVRESESETDHPRMDPVSDQGKRFVPWTQLAIRTRLRGSGPWLETRIQPGLRLGTLVDPMGESDDKTVSSMTTALGLGWIQEFPSGSVLVAGARSVATSQEVQIQGQVQGLVSWVQPF